MYKFINTKATITKIPNTLAIKMDNFYGLVAYLVLYNKY